MPELDIQGTKRKVAWYVSTTLDHVNTVRRSPLKQDSGPCIRGHRSSKCEHKDRVLVEVRKPGRPLSACPHPPGSCNCDQIVLNYTIPKCMSNNVLHSKSQTHS
ncbi:hypothetical protein EV356DRAFT_508157 [Viridothelium virens]|uniref:Copper-fist domain-containing protein n=1 Tax=Viridothelium virens TaxID=1048519 RepID=A0A6A6GZ10_VIRVR|nr:hypothetical protein EV356DRAFT_508157 [Viridothelium virens]